MPENQSNKVEVNWDLYDLDHQKYWLPQFPIYDINMSVGSVLSDQPRFGFQDAITNWTRGKTKTIAFQTMLFARSDEEGLIVSEQMEALEALSTQDTELGRSPICIFSLGGSISEVCMVESTDPTIVSTLRGGDPREVRYSITLRRYVPFSQQQIDPTKPVKESFLLVASAAEQSYEGIARRYYGEPLLGDRLRKRHPEFPFAPTVGSIVKVPAKAVILQETVQPASHILSLTNEAAVAAYETILEDRNARTLTVVK